jgi:DNA helicase-2/ATP-dependent DNA helicase PcrA
LYNRRVGRLAPDDLLRGLNPSQLEAVTAGEGPLLVLAGAGSGKTRVIAHRIAHTLAARGVSPRNVLAVTFTNKAAEEMARRVEALTQPLGIRAPLIATFHSACVRILREHVRHLGYKPHFTIYDEDDRQALVKECMREHKLDERTLTAGTLASRISHAKNQMQTPDDVDQAARGPREESIAAVYRAYEDRLRAVGALDFDDLLLVTVKLFARVPEVLAWYRGLWKHVLVDEYQDTNRAQYRIIRQLTSEHRNICVVGDPDQCLVEGTLIETPAGPTPIEKIREGDRVTAGAGWGSSRVGRVEETRRSKFSGDILAITTEDGREVRATPNHMMFVRVDPDEGCHYVYLMYKRRFGYRIGVTRGVRAGNDGEIASGLQMRTNGESADRVWILASCSSSAEARYLESFYAAEYGLPTLVFHVRGRHMAVTQEHIDRLYKELDTESRAERLMNELLLFPEYPHHRAGALTRGDLFRRVLNFTMFGDPRPFTWHEHRIQIASSDRALEQAMSLVTRTRPGKRRTWRVETSRKDYDKGLDLARSLAQVGNLDVVRRARLTPGRSFQFMPASHVRPGMTVPVSADGEVREARVVSVKREPYHGFVYDLGVEDFRNYVAGGVLVHNSVYKWRGADIKNILDFEHDYPGTTVVRLEQNYRSTKRILAIAADVIANNVARKPKTLWTDNAEGARAVVYRAWDEYEEANFVAQAVIKARGEGTAYQDIALFYRTNAQSRVLEDALRRGGIPYVIVGGVKFYERKEVKDTVAYLRLIVNPADDVAFRRAIGAPLRGVGRVTLTRLDEVATREGRSLLEMSAAPPADVRGSGRKALEDFAAMIGRLRTERPALALPAFIDALLAASGYRETLKLERSSEAEARLENLEELIAAAEDFSERGEGLLSAPPTLEAFLDTIALVSDVDEMPEGRQAVTLMTLHSAKGLEFPVVFLTGLEEGVFPHARSMNDAEELEEERRLCYVGVTRAKERLFLSYALHRRLQGYGVGEPSRFLREMPEEHLDLVNAARAERAAAFEPEAPRYEPHLDDDLPLKVGAHVRHGRFGEGMVVGVEREGEDTVVTVRFASVGRRRLSLQYAHLEEL